MPAPVAKRKLRVVQPGAAPPSAALRSAARTLDLEREGLQALRAALEQELGASLCAAVAILAAAKGRVIVTGIGKSGLVAQKLAATFASTGTPAFFVHPSEASHGDLGMITPRGCDRRPVVVGRDRGARQHPHLLAPLQGTADRHHLAGRLDACQAVRRGAGAAARQGGLSARPGADHVHHHAAGAGRLPGHRAARATGLHRARLQGVPPRRIAGCAAQVRRRHHAHGRQPAAGARGQGRCPRRS